MYSTMCMTGKGDSYRAEDGQRGDGRWPPQARDTGRGMRSRVEVYRRPPDGAKRRRGALAEFRRRRKGCECDGVGSRREETPRGKGAKRLAGPKLRIDRGGMGGGGEVSPYREKIVFDIETHIEDKSVFDFWDYKWGEGGGERGIQKYDPIQKCDYIDHYIEYGTTQHYFTKERWQIFHYCIFADEVITSVDGKSVLGLSELGDDFIIGDGRIETFDMLAYLKYLGAVEALLMYVVETNYVSSSHAVKQAGVFMHELGHNLGLDDPDGWEGFGSLSDHSCMNSWYILHDVKYTQSEWGTVIENLGEIGNIHTNDLYE